MAIINTKFQALNSKQIEISKYSNYKQKTWRFKHRPAILCGGLEIRNHFGFRILNLEFFYIINWMIMILFVPLFATSADVGSLMRKGNSLMRKGKYEDALKTYEQAQVLEPDNIKIHYNMGRALYKMGKYPEAIGEFELGILTKDKKFQANTFYNIGNCKFKQGDIDGAINAYKTALLFNNKDIKAKQNLEFCLKLKEELKNQPQSDSTKQQKEQPQPQPQIQTQRPQMSKEDANRILEALKNKEKEQKKKQPKPEMEKVEKDW
uniref:Tetratricopeptide repeat protein n=1 Tax=candidate division WOR-3 bacterium TaxID=2052148 RepID=A0A7C4TCY9_UNCW3